MSHDPTAAGPALGRALGRAPSGLLRLADAILIPPFPGASPPGWVLRALERGLGGVTLFGQNISASDQVRSLTAALRAAAPDEPVIAIDEEGGDVTRVDVLAGEFLPGERRARRDR